MRPAGIRRLFRIPRFGRGQIEREIDDELEFHIAERAKRLRDDGMPADEALSEARRRFGDRDAIRGACIDIDQQDVRQERVMDFIDNTVADLKFALRSFRRAPGFTIVATTTLTLGIALVSAIFSYYDAVYLAPLPYHDADRIRAIGERHADGPFLFSAVSRGGVRVLRESTRSFERIATYDVEHPTVLLGKDPQQIAELEVDTAFFPLFAIRPQLGRLPSPEEIAADANVAVISDVLWRARFGADPRVTNRALSLNGQTFRIVGVLPPGFRFPWQTDVIAPLRAVAEPGATWPNGAISVLAKLRRGASPEQARAELAAISRRLALLDPKVNRSASFALRDEMLDRQGYNFLPLPSLFLGAGFFLLLIACANVTNLFYMRAAERRGEMAVRASLGAGHGRLIRQALAEAALLSAAAAILGTWLAVMILKLWLHTIPTQGFPAWFHVALDARTVVFAAGVMALVTITVGLAPAREGARFDLVRALKGASDRTASSKSIARGSRRGLVLQLALSVSLFIAAMLLVRSYGRLLSLDLGYPAASIATVEPLFDQITYKDPGRREQFMEDVLQRGASVPGVRQIAIRGNYARLRTDSSDHSTPGRFDPRLIPDGDSTRAVSPAGYYDAYAVSDGYFNVLGTRLRAGRSFDNSDDAGQAPVAVVSARTAALLWPGRAAIGHTVTLGRSGATFTVIGVVDDVRQMRGGSRGLTAEPGVTLYFTTRQAYAWYPEIVARGPGDVIAIRNAIVDIVRAKDPALLLLRETTLAAPIEQNLFALRVFGGVIGAIAASALLLSMIGIYGVVAFGIAQRTREIGIRIALGATSELVTRTMTAETLRLAAVGLAIGVALAVALSRLLKMFLFGVSPLDPLTYALVGAGFVVVAVVASYLPARRVSRVDPLIALRAD